MKNLLKLSIITTSMFYKILNAGKPLPLYEGRGISRHQRTKLHIFVHKYFYEGCRIFTHSAASSFEQEGVSQFMVIGQALNHITRENPDNHQTYLKRMQKSAQHSTKSLIPIYTKPGHILDVGCGNGYLMQAILKEYPASVIEGLELNSTTAQTCRDQGLTVYEQDISEFAKKSDKAYDCIIFSSVLHEISSYDSDPEERFTMLPIENAIRTAYKLLLPGGRLIIRDGLAFASDRVMHLQYHNPKVGQAFEKYIKETPIPAYHTGQVLDNAIEAPGNCLKEFLFTYTWGEKSWHREIQEKYGILTCGSWINAVQDAGYIISRYITSGEQYMDYLLNDFDNTMELHDLLNENTILICAVK